LDSVFNQTRQGVFKESHEEQLPWTSSSVIGDFYFNLAQDTNTTAPKIVETTDTDKNPINQKREIEKTKPSEVCATQKVQAFLQKSLKSQEGHDLYGVLEDFERKVEPYFDMPSASHDDIYNDKKSYFTQWNAREYKLDSVDIKRYYEYLDSFYCDINYKMIWSTTNKEHQKKGSSIIAATLKSVGEGFKITAINTVSTTVLLDKSLSVPKTPTRTITNENQTKQPDTTQNPNLYVCYDKRIKQSQGVRITFVKYEGCKRYNAPCASLGKEHFGKYPSDLLAQKALIRCQTSRPCFVD
ncbi:MAG: hypothetical protein JXQ76_03085, partial [Campylobacterales bacterium]|nr:hypothetical protein [Campylobacterales bacterium]